MQNVVINMNSRLEPATGWFSCYFVQILFLRVAWARPEVGRRRLTGMSGSLRKRSFSAHHIWNKKIQPFNSLFSEQYQLLAKVQRRQPSVQQEVNDKKECVLARAAGGPSHHSGPRLSTRVRSDLHQQQQTRLLIYSSHVKPQTSDPCLTLGFIKYEKVIPPINLHVNI